MIDQLPVLLHPTNGHSHPLRVTELSPIIRNNHLPQQHIDHRRKNTEIRRNIKQIPESETNQIILDKQAALLESKESLRQSHRFEQSRLRKNPSDRINSHRKPIFSAQKIQSSNIKFILPQLHEYTPQMKSKIELRSMLSAKESLDLSFNQYEFVNSNNIAEAKDETIISQDQPLLQSIIQTSVLRSELPESSQNQNKQRNPVILILGILGLLVSYCLYVSLR